MPYHLRTPRRTATALAIPLVALFCMQPAAQAQEVTLTIPPQVTVGMQIEIRWNGPLGNGDFISVDEAGAAENRYGNYVYANSKQPAQLRAPDMPGTYAVRYHGGGRGYPVLAAAAIEVLDTQATIAELAAVGAGEEVRIVWTGPAGEGDFISIDPPGSGDRKYGPYAYAKESPVVIRTPDEAGEYVVRYHLGQTYRVIGQTDLTIAGVTAVLDGPAQTPAGGKIEVHWGGPDGLQDYISIDPAGAGEREYGHYQYTRVGNPVEIVVPIEPGSYEIRYHMGRSRKVLAVSALEVLANVVAIQGPAAAAAGSKFEVTWEGPDNQGDYLTIVPAGADHRKYLSYDYTKHGTPLVLEAPLDVGAYELRYLSGQGRVILADSPIEITPGVIPGKLWVAGAGVAQEEAGVGAVEVILDASGSMLKRIDGELRIDVAKNALDRLVREVIPAGTTFALRAFGHREENSCRTDLDLPAAPLNAATAIAAIRAIQPQAFARTPIAASLLAVQDDLAGISGPVTIVLVTDGEETCDGDPRAAIDQLTKAGFEIHVNIVGFAIDEHRLREQFEEWARAGQGRYIEAHNAEQLDDAMSTSVQAAFEVLRADQGVATGLVNGEPLTLPPGTYRVRALSSRTGEVVEVTIEPRGEHRIDIP